MHAKFLSVYVFIFGLLAPFVVFAEPWYYFNTTTGEASSPFENQDACRESKGSRNDVSVCFDFAPGTGREQGKFYALSSADGLSSETGGSLDEIKKAAPDALAYFQYTSKGIDLVVSNRAAVAPTSSPVASSGGSVPSSGGSSSGGAFDYEALEAIPGSESTGDISPYLQAMYRFALWAVGIAALFMLSIGGMMYLTSAGNTSQIGTAKNVIFDSLIGLALALAAWLILYVINPQLIEANLEIFKTGPAYDSAGSPGSIGGPGDAVPGSGQAGSCNGVSTTVKAEQCADVSPKLADLIVCVKGKYPDLVITSISHNRGFNTCKNDWTSACEHGSTSCHFGGGISKQQEECQKSQAVDFSIRNAAGNHSEMVKNAIVSAAKACGGRVNPESTHVHVSTQTECCTL